MADHDSTPSSQAIMPLSSSNLTARIAGLSESKSELLTRIQILKQDMQNWRSKLDTQVKVYRNELSELKKTLNVVVEQLRTEFQELKGTLQKQQEEVTTGLKNLGINDTPKATETEASKAGDGAVQLETPKAVKDNLKDANRKTVAISLPSEVWKKHWS